MTDTTPPAVPVSLLRQYLPLVLMVLTALGGAVGVAPVAAGARVDEVESDVALVVCGTRAAVAAHANRLAALTLSPMANDATSRALLDAVREDVRDLSVQVEALRELVARSAGGASLQRAVDRAAADEPEVTPTPAPVLPELAPAPRLPSSIEAMRTDAGP